MAVDRLFLLATEAGGAEEGIVLLPEFAELLWGFLGFAVLMAFMSKFALPRLNAMLDERGRAIQGQMEQAEATRVEAEEVRRQYQAQLADARNEADAIIDDARKTAERLRSDTVSRAEEEAAQIVAKAREDAEGARSRVIAELRGQVALASVELAGKIVQRELDPEQHRALVDQYINELSGLN